MTRFLLTAASILTLTVGAAQAQSSGTAGSSGSMGKTPAIQSVPSDTHSGSSLNKDSSRDCPPSAAQSNGTASGSTAQKGADAMNCPPGSRSTLPDSSTSGKSSGAVGGTGGGR